MICYNVFGYQVLSSSINKYFRRKKFIKKSSIIAIHINLIISLFVTINLFIGNYNWLFNLYL